MASRTRARSRPQKADILLEELKKAVGEAGIRVREERLLGDVGYRVRSGACTLRGENLILLDRSLPPANRLDALLGEVSRLDWTPPPLSPELSALLRIGE